MKAKTLYICTFTNVDPGNEAWNLDALPAQDAQLESAAGNGTSDLIFKDGLSDMEGNVVSNLCYFKHPNFQDFLKAANAPAPPFVAIMGVFPDGKKRLFIVKSPQQVKIHIRAMWLGEFGSTGQPSEQSGEGEGGFGMGDSSFLCQLLPPLCALGFWPWLILGAFTTYRAAEANSNVGRGLWGTAAFFTWKEFIGRGGLAQLTSIKK